LGEKKGELTETLERGEKERRRTTWRRRRRIWWIRHRHH